jgi:drug/metabolite transporter (DMT)-like permease
VGLLLVAAGVVATITGSSYGAENAAPNEFIGLMFCLVATLSNALMMTFSGKIMVGRGRDGPDGGLANRHSRLTRVPRRSDVWLAILTRVMVSLSARVSKLSPRVSPRFRRRASPT